MMVVQQIQMLGHCCLRTHREPMRCPSLQTNGQLSSASTLDHALLLVLAILAKEMCPAPMLDKTPVQGSHNAELLRHSFLSQKGWLLSQDRLAPGSTPSSWAMCWKYWMRSGPPLRLDLLGPHSMPPFTMLVTVPKPGRRPAAVSAAEGTQVPVMTAWAEGLLPAGVILGAQGAVRALHAALVLVALCELVALCAFGCKVEAGQSRTKGDPVIAVALRIWESGALDCWGEGCVAVACCMTKHDAN